MDKNSASEAIKKKSTVREYVEAAIIAVILALFIRTFVVQAFKIPSGSMVPTLQVGDHILVNKFIYGIKIPILRTTLVPIGQPDRGDVIVFIHPGEKGDKDKDFIKRVVALPGEKIEVRGRKIYINGVRYEDNHGFYADRSPDETNPGPSYRYGSVTVPEDQYYVMGDNRDHSFDSRFWGFVPFKSIKGKAFIIYWSWPRWKRFLDLIR